MIKTVGARVNSGSYTGETNRGRSARAPLSSLPPLLPPMSDPAVDPHTTVAPHTTDALLLALPPDLQLAVIIQCGVVASGNAAASCSGLARLCDSGCPLWPLVCQQQGLAVEEGGDPKAVLRRAALCKHATDERPASSFDWRCEQSAVQCCCRECGRAFSVTLSNGCIDTPSFASKMVTRADFRALYEAPSNDRAYRIVWDGRAAAAAQPAMRQAEGGGHVGSPALAQSGSIGADAFQSRFESLSFGPRYIH